MWELHDPPWRSALGARGHARRAPRMLLVDADPHLVRLLRERFPNALLILLQPEDDLNVLLHEGPDLVVVDLASPRLQHVQLFGDDLRVLGVGRLPDPVGVGAGVDAVVVRPYDAPSLTRTVERLIRPARPVGQLGLWRRQPTRILPIVELLALALAIPELAGGGSLTAVVVTLAAVLAVAPRRRGGGYLAATVLASILLAVASDPSTSFVPYALVVAGRAGIEGSTRLALACGVTLAIAAAPGAVTASASAPTNSWWMSMAVFPLTSFAMGQAVRLHGLSSPRLHDAREVNRTLQHLQGLVQWLPDDLSLQQAGHRIARSAATCVGASVAVVLTGASVKRTLASHGCPSSLTLQIPTRDLDLLPLEASWTPTALLPDRMSALPLGLVWRVVPLLRGGERIGLLVLGRRPSDPTPSRWSLRKVQRDATLDLANALLLRRVQQLGTDAERTRLVQQLNDGIAQSLSHVRFELALLERDLGIQQPNLAGRVRHLRQVTRATMLDVAGAILDLRATSTGSGLNAAIHEFARELTGTSGPSIEVRGDAGGRLDPLAEQELFEITADTVNEALRRRGVSRVTIRLTRTAEALRIAIEADGLPIEQPGAGPAGATEPDIRFERAARVGATLTTTSVDDRHHRVAVTLPSASAGPRSAET